MIHYFLCRERDEFMRIGTEGDKGEIEEYLKATLDSVEYIGEFMDVIYMDVDTKLGIGNRKIPGGIIRTAKYIHQLRTQRKEKDFFKYLREFHQGLQFHIKTKWEEIHGKEH